tara:strand:- start:185 stop:304 length:120 start_codon:yes stop_codon:yes gene_type:complete
MIKSILGGFELSARHIDESNIKFNDIAPIAILLNMAIFN